MQAGHALDRDDETLADEALGRGFPATADPTALVRAVANVRWALAALGDDPDDARWVTDPAGREAVYRMVEGVWRDGGEWPRAVFPWSLGIVLKLFGARRRGERHPRGRGRGVEGLP